MESKNKRELLDKFWYALLLIFMMIFLPSLIGWSAGGFDTSEIIDKFTIYSSIGIGSLLGILLASGIEHFISKGDKKYGNSVCFASPGEPPALGIFKRFTNIQLLFLSLIFFSLFVIFLYGFGIQQTSFVGIKHIEQQFTPTGDLSFSSLLVPAAENLAIAFAIAFILSFGIRRIARKNEWTKANFVATSFAIIPLIVGFLGIANHILRYANSDVSLFTVFAFWFVVGLLTLSIGSFSPAWSLHVVNNVIFSLKDMALSIELIVTYNIFVSAGLIVLYLFIYRGRWLGEDPSKQEMPF